MGLDIGAYSKLKPVDAAYDAYGNPIDKVTGELLDNVYQPCVNDDFPGREGSIVHRKCYEYESYKHFFSRSYSGYNQWRNQLAKMAGYPLQQYEQYGQEYDSHCVACWNGVEGPFSELINFSDCEGVIGPEVSAKLAADFALYQDKADAHEDERFKDGYTNMRAAFDMASDGGAVSFH